MNNFLKILSSRGVQNTDPYRIAFMDFLQKIPSIPNPPKDKNKVLKDDFGPNHSSLYFVF